MINHLSKNRNYYLLGLLLVFAYFGSRLLSLTTIPIFTDEAIYLRWSQIMAYDASLRYLPLVDGKQPLYMWLVSIAMRLLPNVDVLFVGRLVAIFGGFFGMIGLFFAGKWLFSRKETGFFAMALYLFTPFTFMYDRLALADSLLAAFVVWAFALAVLFVRKAKLDLALLLGGTIGLGLLTKTPALFSLLSLPLFLALFDWSPKDLFFRIGKLAFLSVIVVILSQSIYSILRLFPLFQMISQKNSEFVVPLSQFLESPFHWLGGNLPTLIQWEIGYLTLPVAILVVLGLGMALVNRKKELLVVVAAFCLHFFAMASFNKVLYPRYLLTFTPMLLLSAAYVLTLFWTQIKISKVLKLLTLVAVFTAPTFVISRVITSPVDAPIVEADSYQYLNSWAAGFGVVETRQFLETQSKSNQKVIILTEGTFGLMPYALDLYQKDYQNVEIQSVWPLPETVPERLLVAVKNNIPVFVLVYQHNPLPVAWPLEKVLSFSQGNSSDSLRVYRLLSR